MHRRSHTGAHRAGVSEDLKPAKSRQKSSGAILGALRREAAVRTRERRNASRITVGKWTIERADPLNWTLRADAEPDRYFPDLTSACVSLLRERIGDHARRDIKGVLQAVRLAEQEIVKAVKA